VQDSPNRVRLGFFVRAAPLRCRTILLSSLWGKAERREAACGSSHNRASLSPASHSQSRVQRPGFPARRDAQWPSPEPATENPRNRNTALCLIGRGKSFTYGVAAISLYRGCGTRSGGRSSPRPHPPYRSDAHELLEAVVAAGCGDVGAMESRVAPRKTVKNSGALSWRSPHDARA
jgi:hypothetical protein